LRERVAAICCMLSDSGRILRSLCNENQLADAVQSRRCSARATRTYASTDLNARCRAALRRVDRRDARARRPVRREPGVEAIAGSMLDHPLPSFGRQMAARCDRRQDRRCSKMRQ